MVMQIPFPTTSLPGRRVGDGAGLLSNCYARKNGNDLEWLRVPGLRPYVQFTGFDPEETINPRGLFATETTIFAAYTDKLITTVGGVPSTAVLDGGQPITFGRNLRQPIPDVVFVTENGAFIKTPTGVADYPDADVGFPNSVSYFSGYFMFTYGNGDIRASQLQSTDIEDLSVARAEQNPDGLMRGVGMGGTWLAMGNRTIEAWQDQATVPFPLQRAYTIPVGLLAQWCVAGGGDDWDRALLFVASDYTVRMLDGQTPRIVSNADVAMDIYNQRTRAQLLRAHVHVSSDNAFWTLSCPDWTWEYNVSTNAWHKRRSYLNGLQPRWRAQHTVNFANKWIAQDRYKTQLVEITSDVFDEDLERLIARCESAPLKDFPINVRVPRTFFDFTVGLGRIDAAPPFQSNPSVLISWSHNGGATWANPLKRSLGQQGKFGTLVQVNNMGRSTHHGVRFAWEVIDPVYFVFRKAIVSQEQPRRPAAVAGARVDA